MLTRVLTALALLPILAVVYFGPPPIFLLLSIAAGLACTREVLRLHEAAGSSPLALPAHAGVVLLNLSWYAPAHLPPELALFVALVLAVGAHLALRDTAGALSSIPATLAAMLLPGWLLAFQVALRMTEAPPDQPRLAQGLLLFLFAAVFGQDAGAYFVGRAMGRTKLAPSLSPHKTVEGMIGGVACGTVLGAAMAALLLPRLPLPTAAGYALLLSVVAVTGDLTVSLLKRSAGVKDSGHSLPGHGGVLDRLSGLLPTGPLLVFLVAATIARGDH